MKMYRVYSFDFTVEPDKQEVRTIAICDNQEDAMMIYEKHFREAASNEMVRVREVLDADLINLINA